MKDKELAMHDAVLALTDFDICRHLAELEGLSWYEQFGSVRIMVVDGDDYYFNPLNDNDQWAALFHKYQVERTYMPYDMIGFAYHVLDGDNPLRVTERQNLDIATPEAPDLTMQKASCLAILLNRSPEFSLS